MAIYSKLDFFRKALPFLSLSAALVMAVVFPFSFAAFNVGAVVLMVCFFLRRMADRNYIFFDSLMDLSLIGYFLICGASVFFAGSHQAQALQGMHKMGRYMLLFIAARESFQGKADASKVIWAILAGGIIAGGDGLLQFLLGTDPLRGRTPFVGFEQLIRITSSFNNPNGLVIYLAFLIPLAGYLAIYGRRARYYCAAAFLLMSVAAVLTFSRTAAIALGGAGLGIFLWRKDFRGLVAAAAVTGAAFFLLPKDIRLWMSQLSDPWSFLIDISRSYHHQAAWNMIVSHPWFGVGINTFDVNYAEYKAAADTVTRWSAHQAYLQIAAETGLVGFLAFLILLGQIFGFCFRAFQKTSDIFLRDVLAGFGFGMLAFLITGFFESNLWQPRQTYFFWFWAGLWCGLAKWAIEKKHHEA